MNKHIILIINGFPLAGKDTFISFVEDEIEYKYETKYHVAVKSSIDIIKEVAAKLGWFGTKETKDRKFLSDLKVLSSNYNNFPINYLTRYFTSVIFNLPENKNLLGLTCIREKDEIDSFILKIQNDLPNVLVKKIIIKGKNENKIFDNLADQDILNSTYDFEIENFGSLQDFQKITQNFLSSLLTS